MRKVLFGFLLTLAAPLIAQVSAPSIISVSVAPSGACSLGLPNRQVISTGTQYSCQAGTWGAIAGSGAGTTTNPLTGAATGGAAPGSTFNGSAAVTFDYHTVGAQQVGTSSSNPTTCTANSTGNKCLGVSPYLAVAGDWTAAIRQAITDLTTDGGGTLWVPTGTYNVNGSLTNTCSENAVISMPCIPYFNGNGIAITIRGFNWPTQFQQGSIITTAITTGNLFGGNNTAGNTNPVPMTYVWFGMENLTINGPANTGAVMVNAQHISGFSGKHLAVLAPSATLTSTTGAGILMPVVGNSDQSVLDDVTVENFYTGMGTIGEHSDIGRVIAQGGHDCFVFDLGPYLNSGVPYGVGSLVVRNMAMSNCTNGISAGATQNSYINVLQADFDISNTTDINDPSNFLHGILVGKKGNTGTTPGAIVTTGAQNLNVLNSWSNKLSFAASPDKVVIATPVEISVVEPLSITATGVNAGFSGSTFMPNLGTGNYVYQSMGIGCSPDNIAYWGFKNVGGSGSASNFGTLGMCYADNILNWFPTSHVAIGSTTDPGVALGVTGTIAATAGTFGTSATVAGNNVCQSTGTNCPYAPVSVAITSPTAGSGITSVTCATASCTNLRGTYTVVGGTATTGTIITLVWPTTTTAYACSATQNDTGVATAYLGLGHSVATATGMTISAGISVIGTTFNVDYSCQP